MPSSLFIQVKANSVYNASTAAATHLDPSTESRTAKANTMIKVTLCGSGHLGWLTGRYYASLGRPDKNLRPKESNNERLPNINMTESNQKMKMGKWPCLALLIKEKIEQYIRA